jgi:hypothetical protein
MQRPGQRKTCAYNRDTYAEGHPQQHPPLVEGAVTDLVAAAAAAITHTPLVED